MVNRNRIDIRLSLLPTVLQHLPLATHAKPPMELAHEKQSIEPCAQEPVKLKPPIPSSICKNKAVGTIPESGASPEKTKSSPEKTSPAVTTTRSG